MSGESLNGMTLKERFREYLKGPKESLRDKLVEAASHHQGWEESAVALVDEALMPVIRQHTQPAGDVDTIAEIAFKKGLSWCNVNNTVDQVAAWSFAKDDLKAAITAMGNVQGINIDQTCVQKTPENEHTSSEISVNYSLSEMPNGEFVREVYYLTHDIIKHLGANVTNEQFCSAERALGDYVWKACKRAISTSASEPVYVDLLKSIRAKLDHGIHDQDWQWVEEAHSKISETLAGMAYVD